MTTRVSDCMPRVLQQLEQHFVYRKIGFCLDLWNSPDAFPNPTLPTSADIRNQTPNDYGFGTGIAYCMRNNAWLFDGYLMRIEYGFADPSEDRIFDRLIGGMIRLATIAPKGSLIRGLSADGRSHYPRVQASDHLYWAFMAWRCYTTGAIATESQDKIRNIAQKWLTRLERSNYALDDTEEATEDRTLLTESGPEALILPAILAAGAVISGSAAYATACSERLKIIPTAFASMPDASMTAESLLIRQLACRLLAQLAPEEAVRNAASQAAIAWAPALIERLQSIAHLEVDSFPDSGEFDWHNVAESMTGEQEALQACPRMQQEDSSIGDAMRLSQAILLCHDKESAKPAADCIRAWLESTPWESLRWASALAPTLSIHARGVELGLWDAELQDYALSFDGTLPLVTPYMADAYDEEHPDRAGHVEAPKKKPLVPESEQKSNRKGGRRKRRRRKRRS